MQPTTIRAACRGLSLCLTGLLGLVAMPGSTWADDTALADSLKQSLESQGWQSASDDQGNRFYHRDRPGRASADERRPAEAKSGSALQRMLEAKGWKVEWDDEHNMILYPPERAVETLNATPPQPSAGAKKADTALADSLASSLERQGWRRHTDAEGNAIYTREPTPSASSANDAALKKALEAKGWKVEWDDEHNLILYPPAKPAGAQSAPVEAESGPAESAPDTALADSLASSLERQGWRRHTDAEGNAIYTRESQAPDDAAAARRRVLKQALERKGWRVDWDEEGNMVLRPPSSSSAGNRSEESVMLPASCAAVTFQAEIDLPVDTLAEVKALADAWLDEADLAGAVTGRVRKVLRVYLVSIVARRAPHRLMHQLAVRARDGGVMLLD